VVSAAIQRHLDGVGSTNVGGGYHTSEAALRCVTGARQAAKELLGAASPAEITFGLNATNLLFHLSRAMSNTTGFMRAGDNVVLSRACHDSNVAPWVQLVKEANARLLGAAAAELTEAEREAQGVSIKWVGTGDSCEDDALDLRGMEGAVDERTRVVAIGLASNATGRVHTAAVAAATARVQQLRDQEAAAAAAGGGGGGTGFRCVTVLDGTHYVPHHHFNLVESGADVIACSAYKFCGPHVGVMAFGREQVGEFFQPVKVGNRCSYFGGETDAGSDLLACGLPSPEDDGCEISGWEMGTLPYESLAGFTAVVEEYFKEQLGGGHVGGGGRGGALGRAYLKIRETEDALAQRFLAGLAALQQEQQSSSAAAAVAGLALRLHGSAASDGHVRTPTFALSASGCLDGVNGGEPVGATYLVEQLNARQIYCTHGNHYAVHLVGEELAMPTGVTRVSFLHYNSEADVDTVLSAMREICAGTGAGD
jgi:selenocysteine lyase/cysteine desulfurase